jgi:hypothetical protein
MGNAYSCVEMMLSVMGWMAAIRSSPGTSFKDVVLTMATSPV